MPDAGDVDLILGPVHDDLPAAYRARPLVPESLVLVTPPGHPLAARRNVALAAPGDEPFVCLPADSRLRAILTGAGAGAGKPPPTRDDRPGNALIRA